MPHNVMIRYMTVEGLLEFLPSDHVSTVRHLDHSSSWKSDYVAIILCDLARARKAISHLTSSASSEVSGIISEANHRGDKR